MNKPDSAASPTSTETQSGIKRKNKAAAYTGNEKEQKQDNTPWEGLLDDETAVSQSNSDKIQPMVESGSRKTEDESGNDVDTLDPPAACTGDEEEHEEDKVVATGVDGSKEKDDDVSSMSEDDEVNEISGLRSSKPDNAASPTSSVTSHQAGTGQTIDSPTVQGKNKRPQTSMSDNAASPTSTAPSHQTDNIPTPTPKKEIERPPLLMDVKGSLNLKEPPGISQEKLLQLEYRRWSLNPHIIRSLFQDGDDNEKIIDWQLGAADRPGGAVIVHRRSFLTLQPGEPGEWLNDEVMNGYANVLNVKYYYNNTGANKCFVVSSMLLKKLSEREQFADVVQKWLPEIDIFALDKLLFLYNIGNAHWALVYVNIRGKRIEYIDSMVSKEETTATKRVWAKDAKKVINRVWKYLNDVSIDRKKTVLEKGWRCYCYGSDTPQQKDGNNCGVFALVTADYILSDLPLIFANRNMEDLRPKIAYCLLQKGNGVTLSEICNSSTCSAPILP